MLRWFVLGSAVRGVLGSGVLFSSVLFSSVFFSSSAAHAEDEPRGAASPASIEQAIEALASSDGPTQDAAIRRLAAVGSKAVPALRRGLMSADLRTRLAATKVLDRMGPPAAAATAALIENLADDSQALVAASARALGRTRTEEAIAALRSFEREAESLDRRIAAYQGLALAGAAGIRVLRVPLRRSRDRRAEVFQALRALVADAAPALTALLRDPSWHVRLWTVREGPPLDGMPVAWLDAVRAACRDESSAVALAATQRLTSRLRQRPEKQAQDAPSLVPILVPTFVALLSSPHRSVRQQAAFGLCYGGPLDAATSGALLDALRNATGASGLQVNLAWALGEGPDAPAVRAALRAMLAGSHAPTAAGPHAGAWDARPLAAARSLAKLGDRAADLMPALLTLHARYGRIDPPFPLHTDGGRQLIGGGYKRFDAIASQQSMYSAQRFLPVVAAHHPERLEQAMWDATGVDRLRLLFVLARLGEPAFEALRRTLRTKDVQTRIATACCLARFGARGRIAIPVLIPVAIRHEPGDPEVPPTPSDGEDGEPAALQPEVELPEEEEVGTDGLDTTWVLECRDALVAIGAESLKPVETAAADDRAVALRLALTLRRLHKAGKPTTEKAK